MLYITVLFIGLIVVGFTLGIGLQYLEDKYTGRTNKIFVRRDHSGKCS